MWCLRIGLTNLPFPGRKEPKEMDLAIIIYNAHLIHDPIQYFYYDWIGLDWRIRSFWLGLAYKMWTDPIFFPIWRFFSRYRRCGSYMMYCDIEIFITYVLKNKYLKNKLIKIYIYLCTNNYIRVQVILNDTNPNSLWMFWTAIRPAAAPRDYNVTCYSTITGIKNK